MNAPLPIAALPTLSGQSHFPVVIIGAGPTGLMLANLLGTYGVAALVIERSTNTVGEPRAVTIDDESLRTVQATGLIDEVLPQVVQGYGVHYYSWRGKEFARIEPHTPEHGFAKRNAFRQQMLVGQLRDGLQRFAGASIWFGHELVKFVDDGVGGNAVYLELRQGNATKHISCSWLIACDGGRSSVREQLGIELTGSSYDEKWLIVDLLDRGSAFRHTRTYCDPSRPAIRLPGPQGTLRYEFMLHKGEDPEQMLDEAGVRSWIHQREPADAQLKIARKVVYAFHARVASRWKSGRVLLAGDAAHLTPPFAGQGMNSGVRDAANLAWKLAAVVQGRMSASLLETYELERKPHAWSLIKMAVRIGAFMQPKSVLAAMLTQGALKLFSVYRPVRDYVLQLKFKPKPRFVAGFFVADRSGQGQVPTGQLFPQPNVQLRGGGQAKLDDMLGHAFAVLALADAAPDDLARARAAFVRQGLSCRTLTIISHRDDFLQPSAGAAMAAPGIEVRDCDGSLEAIIRSAGAKAVVLRPDRYVLAYVAASSSAKQLQELLGGYLTDAVHPDYTPTILTNGDIR
jgi:3-(3-hydroxy-phenyl)propionate hydroxylase